MGTRFLFFSCGLLFFFCSHVSEGVSVLQIGNGGDPNNLDPQKVMGVPEFRVVDSLFEGLVEKDPKSSKPIPAVAERWTISKDGVTYTFHLRKNARWTDGTPVTSQDFIYAWTRLLTPATAAHYSHFGFFIKNGKNFYDGKTPREKLGLTAADPQTLKVTLEKPLPYFLSLMAHSAFHPVPQKVVEKFGENWTKPENLVSNGPFQLKRWRLHDVLEVYKSPTYWDAKNVALSGVNFLPLEQMETEERLFRANQLHVTNSVPPDKVETWKKTGKGALQQHPFLGSYFYNLNVKVPPLNRREVRQALVLAIDRQEIVNHVLKGGQRPATSFTPEGVFRYHPPKILPTGLQKIAEARRLMAAAGFPDGKGFPKLDILYNTSEGHKKIAEAIQFMWKKNLGIDIGLRNEEWKVYLDSKKQGKYSICREGWIGDYNDPTTFLDFFRTTSQLNTGGWTDVQYDQALNQAADESNKPKRAEWLKKAETLLLTEMPIVPIYHYSRVYLKKDQVVGWFPNIEDVHPLKFVKLR